MTQVKENQRDFNILSQLIFEKAELTNFYLYQVLDIFEE